jgi:hypothetical protein
MSPTFFPAACGLTALRFAFQASYLAPHLCSTVINTPFGEIAMGQLLNGLDQFASWVLQGSFVPHTHSPRHLVRGCHVMIYVLQLFVCGTLIYMQYRMERAARQAFLQGKRRLVTGWPRVPLLVQVLLHTVVYMQLFGIVWLLARGDGGSSSMPAS